MKFGLQVVKGLCLYPFHMLQCPVKICVSPLYSGPVPSLPGLQFYPFLLRGDAPLAICEIQKLQLPVQPWFIGIPSYMSDFISMPSILMHTFMLFLYE